MAIDDGDEEAELDVPLEELAETVARRRATEVDRGPAAELPADADGRADVWARLAADQRAQADRPRRAEPVADTGGAGTPGTPVYPTQLAFTLHTAGTVGALAMSVGLYVAATRGPLPERWWVLAIPFLGFGVIGVVPLLSRWLKLWKPEELR
ncbi:MAG: hypothetical protein ABEJ92_02725 [Halobacteriales archaeon]